MPKKTLLLVFIHGFKGGDDTFARFPPHIRALLSHALPNLNILQIQYPKFETRGDLGECVATFKEWLQNKVIDLEVANGTPSPTVDPSVRVILVGHSMGGIVGAETILSIVRDQPIPASKPSDLPEVPFMFPSVLGLLAFDTPYLGISPGVLAHGAESHYQNLRGAWSAYNTVTSAFGMGGGATQAATKPVDASKALPPAPSASDPDVAAVPVWQRWGKYAMYAGAAGAVLAGGAAAYAKRAQISEGWGWATSHLVFVGCLARGAELEHRVSQIIDLSQQKGLGFRNLFTQLGAGAGTLTWKDDSAESGGTSHEDATAGASSVHQDSNNGSWAHSLTGSQRTFCLLPKTGGNFRQFFEPVLNDKATDEINAHMNMFTPKENPGYYAMSERAKEVILEYVKNGWAAIDQDVTIDATDMSKSAVDEEPEMVDEEEHEPEIVEKHEIEEMDNNPWSK